MLLLYTIKLCLYNSILFITSAGNAGEKKKVDTYLLYVRVPVLHRSLYIGALFILYDVQTFGGITNTRRTRHSLFLIRVDEK